MVLRQFFIFSMLLGLIWQVLAPLWVDLKPTRQGQKYSAEICGSWGPNPANLWFFPWFFENIGLCTGLRLIQPPPKDHFYKNYLRCNSEVNPSDAWGAPHPIYRQAVAQKLFLMIEAIRYLELIKLLTSFYMMACPTPSQKHNKNAAEFIFGFWFSASRVSFQFQFPVSVFQFQFSTLAFKP